jgi:hypothetical protein
VPLATLEQVKSYNAIFGAFDSAHDAELERLIASCSSDFVGVAGWSILAETFTAEPYDGDGGSSLWLKHAVIPRSAPVPPVTVTAVVVDGGTIPKRVGTGDGWILDSLGRLRLVGYAFARGVANVEITYSAGYPDAPDDVVQSVIEAAVLAFQRRQTGGVNNMIVGGDVVQMSSSGDSAMFAHSRSVAERYRPLTVG